MMVQYREQTHAIEPTMTNNPSITNYPIETLFRHHPEPIDLLEDFVAMKRIVIIGSSGSGKSTLARQLGATLNLPIIHLDVHYWKPGWVESDSTEWQQKVADFVREEAWIIDGNYRQTLDIRLQAADTVVFLDLPRWLCVMRAIKRRLMYLYRPRPDIAPGCKESLFDAHFWRFLGWIWNYNKRARPDVLYRLSQLRPDQQLFWLRSPAEVARFAADPLHYPPSLLPKAMPPSPYQVPHMERPFSGP